MPVDMSHWNNANVSTSNAVVGWVKLRLFHYAMSKTFIHSTCSSNKLIFNAGTIITWMIKMKYFNYSPIYIHGNTQENTDTMAASVLSMNGTPWFNTRSHRGLSNTWDQVKPGPGHRV